MSGSMSNANNVGLRLDSWINSCHHVIMDILNTPQQPENQAPQAPAQPEIKVRILSQEEKNDLRRRVLSGQPLTLDEARDVVASIRQGAAAAILAGGSEKKSRKKGATKGISDEALDKDLEGLGL